MFRRNMQRILCFFLILYDYSSMSQATPLIGKSVTLAKENEFPFIVSLSFNPNTSSNAKPEEQGHQCGGALITRKHVLTAAHCLDEETRYYDLIVKVGSVDWRKAKPYKILTWITYGDWAKKDVNPDAYYDIAIVTLQENVSRNIKLAVLTKETDAHLYGRKAVTAGWGLIENKIHPRHMRTAKLEIVLPENCPFNIIDIPPTLQDLVPKIYMCSKWTPPVRIACGDSGSPLVINQREIIAITTNCWPDAVVEMSKYRNMHVSINFYRKFIQDVTKLNDNSNCNLL